MFKDELTYGEWESVGFELAKVGKAMQWWIGDWARIGAKYGSAYQPAIDATGMAYQTVLNFTSICKSFEFSRRRENLSFKHHAEVQALEPERQDELLDQAEKERWSCAKLREVVKALKSDLVDEEDEDEEQPEDDCESTDEETEWEDECVNAFDKAENKLETLRRLISALQPHEVEVLKDWLTTPTPS